MMRRRDFLQLGSGTAVSWAMPAWAQRAPSLPLVAVLQPPHPDGAKERTAAIRKGLQETGLVEGIHYAMTLRFAEGRLDRLPGLARELQAMKPAVFIASAAAVGAVRDLQPPPPMVFAAVSVDPIEAGLAKSYERPGGTFTGNVMNAVGGEEGITDKRISYFKEIVPTLKRLGMLGPRAGDLFEKETSAARQVGARSDFEVAQYGIRAIDDLEGAISSAVRDGVDAFYISGSPLLFSNMQRVMPLIMAAAKPTCGVYLEWARAGALMTYATDITDGFRRAGVYAGKILQGTKPGDIPIDQASKFTLAVNAQTAKLLGVTIPTSVLAMADEVIE